MDFLKTVTGKVVSVIVTGVVVMAGIWVFSLIRRVMH